MVVNDRPQKRAKRRVTAAPFDFLTFPDDDGTVGLDGPFRENIWLFLSLHGRPLAPPPILASSVAPSADRPHLLTWRVPFRVGSVDGQEGTPAPDVELYVLEEDVLRSKSIYCDQCRVVGWSDHPVCGKRYHFIIRNDRNSLSSAGVACLRCGTLLPFSKSRWQLQLLLYICCLKNFALHLSDMTRVRRNGHWNRRGLLRSRSGTPAVTPSFQFFCCLRSFFPEFVSVFAWNVLGRKIETA